jgi:hypothetical protein
MKKQLLLITLCAATLAHAGEPQKTQKIRFKALLTYARTIPGKALYTPVTLAHYIHNSLPSKATMRSTPRAAFNVLKRFPQQTAALLNTLKNALHYIAVGNAPKTENLFYLQDTTGSNPRVDGLRKAFEAYGDQVRNTRTYVTSRTAEYATLATALGTGIAYRIIGKNPSIAAVGAGAGTLAGMIAHWCFNRRAHINLITENQRRIIENIGQQTPPLTREEITEAHNSARERRGLIGTILHQGVFKTQAMRSLKTAALAAVKAQ